MRQLVMFDEPLRVNEGWLGFSKPQLSFISLKCNTNTCIIGISYLDNASSIRPDGDHEIS